MDAVTMSSLIRRSAWVDPSKPVAGPAGNLAAVTGIAIHYPGVPDGALKLNDPIAVLRSTHLFYLAKKPTGYSIGYNFATFPSGRFELRGFDIVNAANKGTNDHTLSINVMVNGDDGATDEQIQFTRDMVEDIWTHLGRQVPLTGHGSLPGAATACPGAGIRAQLAAGLFLPRQQPVNPPLEVQHPTPIPPSEEDDMPRYIAITAPGRNPALVAFGDAGCNVIGLDQDAISNLLPQFGVAGVTNVSTALWDDFIAHKAPAKA